MTISYFPSFHKQLSPFPLPHSSWGLLLSQHGEVKIEAVRRELRHLSTTGTTTCLYIYQHVLPSLSLWKINFVGFLFVSKLMWNPSTCATSPLRVLVHQHFSGPSTFLWFIIPCISCISTFCNIFHILKNSLFTQPPLLDTAPFPSLAKIFKGVFILTASCSSHTFLNSL